LSGLDVHVVDRSGKLANQVGDEEKEGRSIQEFSAEGGTGILR